MLFVAVDMTVDIVAVAEYNFLADMKLGMACCIVMDIAVQNFLIGIKADIACCIAMDIAVVVDNYLNDMLVDTVIAHRSNPAWDIAAGQNSSVVAHSSLKIDHIAKDFDMVAYTDSAK